MSQNGKKTVDVKMCEEPCTDEDAPMSSSLRWSSQKAAYDAIDSITSQVEEGTWMSTGGYGWFRAE